MCIQRVECIKLDLRKSAFITFEGPEGGGKTTQISQVVARLTDLGIPFVKIREPGGTPVGEYIRAILKDPNMKMTVEAELLLFQASRAELIKSVIQPALARGEFVICDRFYHSTIAYQGYGRGMDIDVVRNAVNLATGGLEPDLVLVLDIDYRTANSRTANRAGDRFDDAPQDFHERVRKGFLELALNVPSKTNIEVIDASQSKEKVTEDIWKVIEQRFVLPYSSQLFFRSKPLAEN